MWVWVWVCLSLYVCSNDGFIFNYNPIRAIGQICYYVVYGGDVQCPLLSSISCKLNFICTSIHVVISDWVDECVLINCWIHCFIANEHWPRAVITIAQLFSCHSILLDTHALPPVLQNFSFSSHTIFTLIRPSLCFIFNYVLYSLFFSVFFLCVYCLMGWDARSLARVFKSDAVWWLVFGHCYFCCCNYILLRLMLGGMCECVCVYCLRMLFFIHIVHKKETLLYVHV